MENYFLGQGISAT